MTDQPSGVPRLASRLGFASLTATVLGPLAAHLHLVQPFRGFLLLALGLLLGSLALVLGISGSLRGSAASRWAALLGIVTGLPVIVVALMAVLRAGRCPRINDITTDTADPPRFVAAVILPPNDGRDLSYPGESFARQQREGYGEIAPLRSALAPDAAFPLVQGAASAMPEWEITRQDVPARALEAVDTSFVFRFQDDVVIEVRPDGAGSRVDMRSKSRDGKGDMGVNAQRIAAFFARLRAEPGWQ